MNRSTWLPWVFFGPLLGMLGSYALFQITHWGWAAVLTQVLLAVVVLVLVVAFILNFVWHWRRRGRPPKERSPDDPTFP